MNAAGSDASGRPAGDKPPRRRLPHHVRIAALSTAGVVFNVAWPLLMRLLGRWVLLRPWGYLLLGLGPALLFLAVIQVPLTGAGPDRYRGPAAFALTVGGGCAALGVMIDLVLAGAGP